MNWLIIATLSAFFIKGMCGFANTLVFNTILSFSTQNLTITPLELILGYPSNFIIAWKERKTIDPKICIPLSMLVIAGNIPGILFLKNGNTQLIKIIFGIVVVCIGVEMFAREYQTKKHKTSKLVMAFIGIISGLLSGLYGIGALLAAYVSRTTDNSSAFKGNICIVFIVENTFRIIMYSITGIITWSIVSKAFALIPVMLVGLLIGMAGAKIFHENIIKKAVIIMLILSGVALILTNL